MTTNDSRPDPQPLPPATHASARDSATAHHPTIEHHPDIPVVGPLAGAFTWDVLADTWTWSEEMYAIHGFKPNEVVPTTVLLQAHKHPDDRAKTQGVVDRFLSTGERYACYHRILDAHSQERHVLVVAGGLTDPDGTVTEMSGFMIDLTNTRRNDIQPAINEALDGALEHRGDIEMAKGALMFGYNTDPDEAFAILRTASNQSNLKVNEIARRIVEEFPRGDGQPTSLEHVQALMSRVTHPNYIPPAHD